MNTRHTSEQQEETIAHLREEIRKIQLLRWKAEAEANRLWHIVNAAQSAEPIAEVIEEKRFWGTRHTLVMKKDLVVGMKLYATPQQCATCAARVPE